MARTARRSMGNGQASAAQATARAMTAEPSRMNVTERISPEPMAVRLMKYITTYRAEPLCPPSSWSHSTAICMLSSALVAVAVLSLCGCLNSMHEEQNHPPGAPVVTLLPVSPGTDDVLRAVLDSASVDPDGDLVSYRYAWYRDDSLSDASTADTLPFSATTKGQVWKVVVTPRDTVAAGEPGSASATVVNSPASAPVVAIDPASARRGEALACKIVTPSVDLDGDTIFYNFTWNVDGTPFEDTTSEAWPGDTVSSENTLAGQSWTCTATPHDLEDEGASATDTVEIEPSCRDVIVALLPSFGTYDNPLMAWTELVANWQQYGDCTLTFVEVGPDFTYETLMATGADVLVISDPGGGNSWYTGPEVDAVGQFVQGGHGGLILTYAVTLGSVPLMNFVGVDASVITSGSRPSNPTVSIDKPEHPVCTSLPATFELITIPNTQQRTGEWSDGLLVGAEIVMSDSTDDLVVVAYDTGGWRGIYFSGMPEYQPAGSNSLQVLYNALLWAGE